MIFPKWNWVLVCVDKIFRDAVFFSVFGNKKTPRVQVFVVIVWTMDAPFGESLLGLSTFQAVQQEVPLTSSARDLHTPFNLQHVTARSLQHLITFVASDRYTSKRHTISYNWLQYLVLCASHACCWVQPSPNAKSYQVHFMPPPLTFNVVKKWGTTKLSFSNWSSLAHSVFNTWAELVPAPSLRYAYTCHPCISSTFMDYY